MTAATSIPPATRSAYHDRVAAPHTIVQVLLNLGKGGMEAMAVDLSVALSERGHRVVVLALDAGGEHETVLRAAGVPYRVLGGRRIRDPLHHWRLARLLRAEKAGIVHTHHFATLVQSGIAARAAGARRLVHTEHSFEYLRERGDHRLALRCLSYLADSLVAVGSTMEHYYRDVVRVPATRLSVVVNGIDADRHERVADLRAARARLGLPHGVLVGTAGRLFPEKDYGVLIRAAHHASASVPELQLVIVGDGTERHALEALAAELGMRDRVHFLGWRNDVAQLLPLLDIFVLSSRHEGLPLVVLEAMASRLPILSTPVGDLPIVAPADEAALFFPVGDVPALAARITQLAADATLRARLGAAGAARVRALYSRDRMVDRYLELYGV